jgi:hypothetical protein
MWGKRPWYDRWKKVCKAAGIDPRVTPYATRHTHISHLAKAKTQDKIIDENVGNSPQTRRAHYTHLFDPHVEAEIERAAVGYNIPMPVQSLDAARVKRTAQADASLEGTPNEELAFADYIRQLSPDARINAISRLMIAAGLFLRPDGTWQHIGEDMARLSPKEREHIRKSVAAKKRAIALRERGWVNPRKGKPALKVV